MSGYLFPLTPGYPTAFTLMTGHSFTTPAVDVTRYSSLCVQLFVVGSSSTDMLTISFEQAFDPTLSSPPNWTPLGLTLTFNATGSGVVSATLNMASGAGLGPYIRLNASLPGTLGQAKIFHVFAVARE